MQQGQLKFSVPIQLVIRLIPWQLKGFEHVCALENDIYLNSILLKLLMLQNTEGDIAKIRSFKIVLE